MLFCLFLLFNSFKLLVSLVDLCYYVLFYDLSCFVWKNWLKYVGVIGVNVNYGFVFSYLMLVFQVVVLGQGIVLGNIIFVCFEIEVGCFVMLFEECVESCDVFYLVCEEFQVELGKIVVFRDWILVLVEEE